MSHSCGFILKITGKERNGGYGGFNLCCFYDAEARRELREFAPNHMQLDRPD
jgi:hypothetical protein